jgi:hypothetical protein
MENVFVELYEKVLKDNGVTPEQKEFVEKRAAGAHKIHVAAAAKGPGPAQLTAMHFKAKEAPYRECIKNLGSQVFLEAKADECFRKLKNWKRLSQKEFQEMMGKLEVYGEIFIKMR